MQEQLDLTGRRQLRVLFMPATGRQERLAKEKLSVLLNPLRLAPKRKVVVIADGTRG